VDAAKFAYGSFDDTLAVRGTGHISVFKDRVATVSNDLLGNRFSGWVDIGDGNGGAFAGKE